MSLCLALRMLGCDVEIHLPDSAQAQFTRLEPSYTAFEPANGPAQLRVVATGDCGAWLIKCADQEDITVARDDDLLRMIEKRVIVGLQTLRPELFFIHAGVVRRDDQAVLIAGKPGDGKTTLTCAMLDQGWQYVSDELAPILPERLQLLAYPRAFWFKREPPESRSWAEPPEQFSATLFRAVISPQSGTAANSRLNLTAICVLAPDTAPRPRPITAAGAAASLLPHVLNNQAHPAGGLPGMIEICRALPCFALGRGPVQEMAAALSTAVSAPSAGPD